MDNSKRTKLLVTRSAQELGNALGLNEAETALMELKADLSRLAVEAITRSRMSVNEIVERSGVARSKVSAVKNGATVSVSIDLLVKIIAASGKRLKVRVA